MEVDTATVAWTITTPKLHQFRKFTRLVSFSLRKHASITSATSRALPTGFQRHQNINSNDPKQMQVSFRDNRDIFKRYIVFAPFNSSFWKHLYTFNQPLKHTQRIVGYHRQWRTHLYHFQKPTRWRHLSRKEKPQKQVTIQSRRMWVSPFATVFLYWL